MPTSFSVRRVGALAAHDALLRRRDPGQFLSYLIMPMVLMLMLTLVLGVRPSGRFWLLAVAITVWGASLLAIGTALATVVRSHGELSAVCDIGALTLTSLGGALVPISMFPPWRRTVAPISPGYWGLHMLRSAVRGDIRSTLAAAALLLVLGAAAAVLAGWRMARGWGRATLL